HGLKLMTALREGPPVHYQRPAVDVLFHSAARLHGVPMVAAILTGMGQDGADGLLALRRAGAQTLAEDEQSCVVRGLPRRDTAGDAAGDSRRTGCPRLRQLTAVDLSRQTWFH